MKTFDKTWEQRYRTIPGNKYPVTEVVKFVFRNYKNREGLTALDYGCGSGGNHAWFWHVKDLKLLQLMVRKRQ